MKRLQAALRVYCGCALGAMVGLAATGAHADDSGFSNKFSGYGTLAATTASKDDVGFRDGWTQGKGVGNNIRFLGLVADAELAVLYQAANIHVFPVQHIPHDPEGFGMVALEAAAHGLPTVAYGTGGVVDAVAEGRSGYLVPPGDAHAMVLAIINTLRAGVAMRASSKTFASNFGWPAFGDSVNRLLRCSDDPARASMRRDETQRYK